MHHIFVDENLIDINTGKVMIEKDKDKENFNHLVRVLRIKNGEEVLCSLIPFSFSFDYKTKVCDVSDDKIVMDIEKKIKANELPIRINLYQGLPKSDKLEFIIEKAVELGVYSIIPVEMKYSVAKINDKSDKKNERYNKIAKSAAEQSKRNIIPIVKNAIIYDEMINECVNNNVFNMLFFENAAGINETHKYIEGIKLKMCQCINDKNGINEINIIIGPEGGFSDEEIEKAKNANIAILSLGDRILRTETAAVTAMSILMYELQE